MISLLNRLHNLFVLFIITYMITLFLESSNSGNSFLPKFFRLIACFLVFLKYLVLDTH